MSLLKTLKEIFLHERYGRPDAIPLNVMQQFASLPRLTGLMPYVGWLENERMFILDQGGFGQKEQFSIGFSIEIDPQTGATDEMEKILTGLFDSCVPDTGIQISLYASPDIKPMLDKQASTVQVAELAGIASRRNKFYMGGTAKSLFNNRTYLLRNFRCVVSVSLPLSPFEASDVESAIRVKESIHATLRSAYLGGFDWTPDNLLEFVGDFFDHDRVFKPESRHELDVSYDPERILREQLSNREISSCVSDEGIRFSKSGGPETVMQLFSVKNYPKYSRLGHMGSVIGDQYQAALSMPCPFLITMGAIVQDHESARTYAQLKSARATQNAASYMARFQPELKDKQRDWESVVNAFDAGKGTIRLYHQLLLLTKKEDVSRAEYAARSVWRARGFDLARDYYLQHQAFAASMPMTLGRPLQSDLKSFGRSYTKTLDNAVMTSPLLGEWKGTKNPLITLFGRRGQPMGFDLFDNTGGNYNFAVAALSGSGKSVFVNEMAYRYRASNTKVWIIDVGRSYKNLCELMDGEFIEFADERENKLCLNPFSMVQDINSDMEMLLPLLAEMASPREPLNNYCYSALGSAIKQVWSVSAENSTVTNIYDLLRSGKLKEGDIIEQELTKMAVALEPFTKYGAYASYFEGKANIQFTKDFVVLELEELKSKKDLQAVVMQIIMYRITQEMYLDRSRRKIVIIDEAWDLMGSGSSGHFIEAGYRRARKYGGAFGTITQSIEDYYKSESTKAAINNADWLFLLRQKPENIDRLGKEGKLMIDEWMKRMLSSITTDHGNYSEIFVHSPMGSGVGRLILDPFSMMLFSTRAEDFEKIKTMRRQHGMTTEQAVAALLGEQKKKLERRRASDLAIYSEI
ncbi:MAG: type IV secretion system protein TraC [Sideroxydans sp.]